MSLSPVTIFNTGVMQPFASISISSFNGISPGTAYFYNPVQQVFADKIATLPQSISGAARFNQHAVVASAVPAQYLHDHTLISDPTLIGSVIIMGVLSGKLSGFFKSLRERVDLAIADLIFPVGNIPKYQRTAAYSLALGLLPLIQTHQKLMSTGWKWYSDLPTYDKVDVLTRIAIGDTDFGPDDVVVTRYPQRLDFRVESKDGSYLSLTLNDLEYRSTSLLATRLYHEIPLEFQRFYRQLDWFHKLKHHERRAVCTQIAEGSCEIDTGDDEIAKFQVFHNDLVVVIEHDDKSLEVDTNKRVSSQRDAKAFIREYDRRVKQFKKKLKGKSGVDFKTLARGMAAALLTSYLSPSDVLEGMIIESSSQGLPEFEDTIRWVVPSSLIEWIAQDLENRIS